MGVHRERLAASKAQRRFVGGVKTAFQKWAQGKRSGLTAVTPAAFEGVQLLSIPVPPMLEEALGYRGTLRFVECGYSRTMRQFVYSDGGDSIPSDEGFAFCAIPSLLLIFPKANIPLFMVCSLRERQCR